MHSERSFRFEGTPKNITIYWIGFVYVTYFHTPHQSISFINFFTFYKHPEEVGQVEVSEENNEDAIDCREIAKNNWISGIQNHEMLKTKKI